MLQLLLTEIEIKNEDNVGLMRKRAPINIGTNPLIIYIHLLINNYLKLILFIF